VQAEEIFYDNEDSKAADDAKDFGLKEKEFIQDIFFAKR
jgi:hypothetical protein